MREPPLRLLSQVNNWAEQHFFTHILFFFLSLVMSFLFIVIRAHNRTCSEEAAKVVLALRVPQSQHLADRPLIVFVETLVVPRGILKGCQRRGVIWDVFLWRATQQQRARPARQRKRKGPRVIWWGLCNRYLPESYCCSVTFIFPLFPVSMTYFNPRLCASALTRVSVD